MSTPLSSLTPTCVSFQLFSTQPTSVPELHSVVTRGRHRRDRRLKRALRKNRDGSTSVRHYGIVCLIYNY